ncbi:MAG: hypothetical protein GXO39_01330 [Thermotogae bacterium]|nr:hypothetical protein [Thermotogota bacterium]
MLLVLALNAWESQIIHRYSGYTVATASALNILLGLHINSTYGRGKSPPRFLRYTHKLMGYSAVGLSVVQVTLGTKNYIKLWKKGGLFKRTLHTLLGLTASTLYVMGSYQAFRGDYQEHQKYMYAASGLSLVGTVIWLLPWK